MTLLTRDLNQPKILKKIIAMYSGFDKVRAPRPPKGWQDSMFANR
jgi:hypothetical protein